MTIGLVSLKAVRAFEAVGRLGSFQAAASELGLTPSAVSHAIADLEGALGVELVDRKRRGGHLTEKGELFHARVRVAFDQLRLGLDEVSARTPRLLKLHAAPSFAAGWLSPRLPAFLAKYPDIEIRLSAGTDYSSFTTSEFDGDIVYGPVRAMNVETVPLGEETVAPMCTPEMARQIRQPGDLIRMHLIQSDSKLVRWSHWFEQNGLPSPPTQGIRFDRSFLAIASAADGSGVALESTLLAERDLKSGRLVMPLAGRSTDVRYVGHHLVFPKQLRTNRLLSVFADWLRTELGIPIS